MIHSSIEDLERRERLTSEATNAEIKQHWYHAAILWRKLGDFVSADTCENILQHLAESNLDQLDRRKARANGTYSPSTDDLDWRER